jgi:hypothetical protein
MAQIYIDSFAVFEQGQARPLEKLTKEIDERRLKS